MEPNRSRLERGDFELVHRIVAERWSQHLGETWEELVRSTLSSQTINGTKWASADRWWGRGSDGTPVELDVVAPSVADSKRVLVGEVKLKLTDREIDRALTELRDKIARCPALARQAVQPVIFALEGPHKARADVVTGAQWWKAIQIATAS